MTRNFYFNLGRPFSPLCSAAMRLRERFYKKKIFKSTAFEVPVISVGNLTLGGTGKTPMVQFLARLLQDNGFQPAIISRGYGGATKERINIVSDGKEIFLGADYVGDEPRMLAESLPGVPVLTGIVRKLPAAEAVKMGANVLLLDDGFQHHAVMRDVDVVLLDATRPLGNGWPLPAGNLREFPQALKRADFLLMTRSGAKDQLTFRDYPIRNSYHQLADIAVSLDGHKVPVDQLKELDLLAFAGIANPESFFTSLENIGVSLNQKLAFADHTEYQHSTLEQLRVLSANVDALITTEKDAVKLSADMFELPCYQISMDIIIDNSAELMETITKRLWS